MKETTRDERNVKRVVDRLKIALKNLDLAALIVVEQVPHLLSEKVDTRIRDAKHYTTTALQLIKEQRK